MDAVGQLGFVFRVAEEPLAREKFPHRRSEAANIGRRADFERGGGQLLGGGVTERAQEIRRHG